MRNRQLDFPLMVLITVLPCLLIGLSLEARGAATRRNLPADAKNPTGETAKKTSQTQTDSSKKSSASAKSTAKDAATTTEPSAADSSKTTGKAEPRTPPREPTGRPSSNEDERSWFWRVAYPLIILAVGIVVVLGLIIGLKINAFLALISAAIVVSILAPGPISQKISRVADALGGAVGGIGIVIALAAIIGKCMLDSGAADRIVRAFVGLFGEKRAQYSLLGSGFVLAVPVFFDTVFYLLVPLARSLHRRTKVRYLLYIMAIGAGGAITHTLVPPTPGPLLMASTLGVSIGTMMMIGALVAFPAAIAGLMCGAIADRIMQIPMRELPGNPEEEPIPDDQLPPLWLSLAPVAIPVILISLSTIMTSLADAENAARIKDGDLDPGFAAVIQSDLQQSGPNVAKLIVNHPAMSDSTVTSEQPDLKQIRACLNQLLLDKDFYDEDSFLGIKLDPVAKKLLAKRGVRMKPADIQRMNRALLESAYPESIRKHVWDTTTRQTANVFGFFGNANFALLLSTLIAMWTLARQRNQSFAELAKATEVALMSAGVIILITAGGGAFGKMLLDAQIGDAIKSLFSGGSGEGSLGGMGYLFLGFVIAAVLKIAQGSSTVAMIVGSSMMAAILGGEPLSFNYVYIATAIGAGSLFGSWMNDSGFWIFAKMGGLTEAEALKSWTVMLIVLSLVSLVVTVILAIVLPLKTLV